MSRHLSIISSFLIFYVSCGPAEPEPPQSSKELFTFQVDPNSIGPFEADNETRIPIDLGIVNENNSNEYKKITLTTSSGSFLDNTTSLDVDLTFNNQKTVYLITGNTAGEILIEAQITGKSNTVQDTLIRLDIAYPDDVFLQPQKFLIDSAGDQVSVKAIMLRDPGRGKVSINVPVSFSVPSSVGYFTPPVVLSDNNQEATSTWVFLEGNIEKGSLITLEANANGVSYNVQVKIN